MSEIWPNDYDSQCVELADRLNDLIPPGMEWLLDAWKAMTDVYKVGANDEAKSRCLDEAEKFLSLLLFGPGSRASKELKDQVEPIFRRIEKMTA